MNVDETNKIRTMWLCGALHALTHVYRYYALYGFLSVLVVLALAGLPCLHAIRKREHLERAPAGAATSTPVLRTPYSS